MRWSEGKPSWHPPRCTLLLRCFLSELAGGGASQRHDPHNDLWEQGVTKGLDLQIFLDVVIIKL
jgi:hypothetical protein